MTMYKGKYTATIEIDFNFNEKEEGLLPFGQIKWQISNGALTQAIREYLQFGLFDPSSVSVSVHQKEADLWKEDEHDN